MTWVGRRVTQREDLKLVVGKGTYVDDIHLPGMVHLAIHRSPYAHAAIRSVDPSAALAEGAVAVFTGADLVGETDPFELRFMGSKRPLSYHALVTDRVRYVGEPVAVVAAADRYRAEALSDLLEVDYEPLDVVATPAAGLEEGAPRLYAHWPDNVLIDHKVRFGDVDAAIREADLVVTETIGHHRHAAHPMETRGLVANYDGSVLTVWASHQMPHMLRTVIAECLRYPESRIRVIAPNVGGGFGVKYNFHPEDVLVPFIALKLGRPVKWIEDRREHFIGSAHSREQELKTTVAVKKDGTILGVRCEAVADLGSGAIILSGVGPLFAGGSSMPQAYRFQNYDYRGVGVVTNKTPHGAYRGFGITETSLALERVMDMAAHKLGIDPAEMRRQNLVTREELPFRPASGAYLQSGSFRDSLEAALKAVDYEGFRERQAAARKEGRLLGIGIATYAEGGAASQWGLSKLWGGWEYCRVVPAPDGSVTLYSGLSAQGQNHETMLAQIAADRLGIHMDQVQVVMSDTDKVPYGLGAFASRGAIMGGASAVRACEDLRQKLLAVAARVAEADVDDLEYVNGRVSVRGAADRSWSFAQLARISYYDNAHQPGGGGVPVLEGEGRFDLSAIDRPDDPHGRYNGYATWSDGACVVTCEVDQETGVVRLDEIVLAHDCGTVINPVSVDGQMIGGLAQAVGGALLEELVYSEDGQLMSGSYMDYLMPTATEVPPVKLLHLESMAPEIPGGFKGIGESSTIVGPAAIANAVADALRPLGVEVTSLPLSPSRVWSLIQEGARRG